MQHSDDDIKTQPTEESEDDTKEETVDRTIVIEESDEEDGVETTKTVRADMRLTPDEAESPVSTLLHLEQMIHGYLSDVERLRKQLKSQKEMFKQSFEQDKDFNEVSEKQKEVKRAHNEVKQRIARTDGVSAVKTKIEELQSEMKDVQQALSDYLNRYSQLTQATSFTGPDGEVLTIVRTAKLVKKKD